MNLPVRHFAIATGLSFSLLASFPTAAVFAQASGVMTSPAHEPTVALDKIEVTGSYLPLSGAVSASPVITIEHEELRRSGATDVLRLVKQLTPYFAGNNNVGTELNNGGSGESNLALRNLPTLVLLNGRRVITSPISNASGGDPGVDVNMIPTAMIERVEILKDGASPIYGADAASGVVNIILRKNFRGLELGARYGSTDRGDYVTREASLIAGISGSKGSLTIAAQRFENTALSSVDRPLTTMTPVDFAALGTALGGIPTTNSGTFAGAVNDLILAGSPLAVGATGYNASVLSPGIKSSPSAPAKTLTELQQAGIYIPIRTTPLGEAVGGDNILNTTLYGLPLILPTERDQFAANGSVQLVGRRLEFFGDVLHVETVNGGSGLAPAFVSSLSQNKLTVPANSPYNLFGVTLGEGAARVPAPPGVRTRLDDLGMRNRTNHTDTYRLIGGLRGEVDPRFSWEVAYTLSRSSAEQRVFGGGNGATMNQLMIPLVQNDSYVYDAAGRPLSVFKDAAGKNLPVFNIFAVAGFNDPAAIDAIRTTLYKYQTTSSRSFDALVRGRIFDLPAGKIVVAIGGEYRSQKLAASVDPLYAQGQAIGYPAAERFAGGKIKNKALFLETNIPLAAAQAGFLRVHRLDLTTAARFEDMTPGGQSIAPKVALRLLPFDDTLALRATWTKGVVAPSLYSLFGPRLSSAVTFTLPQGDGRHSAGGATGAMTTFQLFGASRLSNPLLIAAKSRSMTAGLVFSPRQIKGLSLTLDYYNLRQDQAGDIDYTTVFTNLNAYGSASPYAGAFKFADGSRLSSTAPNQVTSTNAGSIETIYAPTGDQKTDGIDLAVDYTRDWERRGQLRIGASATVLFNHRYRAASDLPYHQYARNFTDSANGLGGHAGLLPGYIVKPYAHYTRGPLSASAFVSYYPEVNAPGTLFAGRSATNSQRLDKRAYTIPDYLTTDLALTYRVPDFGGKWLRGFTITGGANNVFNKQAPYVPGGGSGASENNTAKGAYDIIGRFLYLELKKAF